MSEKLQCALAAIDAAHARDPNRAAEEPAELAYGRRMSEALARFAPEASEPLRIAVRGQHIERWKSPRRDFPEGKAGYIAWRNEAKRRHGERLAEIMAGCGYDKSTIDRVRALVRKENLRRDGEAQTLEDVACRPRGRARVRPPRTGARALPGGLEGARRHSIVGAAAGRARRAQVRATTRGHGSTFFSVVRTSDALFSASTMIEERQRLSEFRCGGRFPSPGRRLLYARRQRTACRPPPR